MSNGTIKIESLSDFIKEIAEIKRETVAVYRGQSNKTWKVTSGAYRRLKKPRIEPNSSELLEYNEKLVEKAHRHAKELSETTIGLALLAKLQHHGAATSLIDFTKSASIALWFACQDNKTDGKVFCLDISDQTTFLEISSAEGKKDLNTILTLKFRDKDRNHPSGNLTDGVLSNDDKIAKWEPPIDNRTLKQDSFFVFNTTGKLDKFIKELTISKGKKEQILTELNQLSALSEETVFPDFYGLSQNNAVNKSHGPQNAKEYFLQGNAKYALGYYEEAIKGYDQAIKGYDQAIKLNPKPIKLNSEHAAAYYSRGTAKIALGRHQEAIQDYDKAIEFNSEHAAAYYNRGTAKYDLGHYREAIQDYDKAITHNPQYVAAYNNRGNAKFALENYEEAITDYDKAIELNPRHATAYNNRGVAKSQSESGSHKEAIKDYNKAIKLNPQYALAYNNRGNAKSALKKYKEAIKNYNKAIELNSQYVNAYNGRGAANFALKNYEAAIEDCNQAIELNPKYANAYNGRGNVKSALGNHGEAIEDFVKAKELYTLQGNMAMASECAEIIARLEKLIRDKE